MSRLRPRAATALVALLAAACGAHAQQEGRYAFTATEILRDDCALVPDAEALWDGTLRVRGEIVSMDYDLFFMTLQGEFREVSESFFLDGTVAGVETEVRGAACELDTVHVSVVADSDGAHAFTGLLTATYGSELVDRCRCELRTRFRAERLDE